MLNKAVLSPSDGTAISLTLNASPKPGRYLSALSKKLVVKYFIGALTLFLSSSALSQEENFGVYTNITTLDGHFSGYEIFFVPNSKVIFQEAEGWPKDPIILDMKSDKTNDYVATHPGWGKMIFTFEKEKVTIEFVGSRYRQVLYKGKSFWQREELKGSE